MNKIEVFQSNTNAELLMRDKILAKFILNNKEFSIMQFISNQKDKKEIKKY